MRASIDDNGVNVATGTYELRHGDMALGSGLARIVAGGYKGSIALDSQQADGVTEVGTPLRSYRFQHTSSGYVSIEGDGATLKDAGNDVHQLTLADGSRYTYGVVVHDRRRVVDAAGQPAWQEVPRVGLLTEVAHPDGQRVTLSWDQSQWCTTSRDGVGATDNFHCQPAADGEGSIRRTFRIIAIENSAGFHIDYQYAGAAIRFEAPPEDEVNAWSRPTGYTGRNGSRVLQRVISRVGEIDAYTTVEEVTDPLGRVSRYTESDAPGAAMSPYVIPAVTLTTCG